MTQAAPVVRPVAQVDAVWKRFGDRDVVQGVSFDLHPGEILGLLGPNGAGKTTTIRMLLDIIKPDRGSVSILGQPLSQQAQDRIGYLPEERGLYKGLRIVPTMVYLAELKGMPRAEATRRADELLERLSLQQHRNKKVSELSRGLSQLVQFASTIIHRPAVVVLDEPFANLDPVNMRMMKDVIAELRRDGVTFLLSTHQMEQVEELCDRVVLIDGGTVVLEGRVNEIRRRHRGDTLVVAAEPWPQSITGVTDVHPKGEAYTMKLQPGVQPSTVLRQLLDAGATVERFEIAMPSMEEIFVNVVRARRG